jgi:hypothetical protein
MVLTGILLQPIGHLADKAPSAVIVPIAFFLRGGAAYAFV